MYVNLCHLEKGFFEENQNCNFGRSPNKSFTADPPTSSPSLQSYLPAAFWKYKDRISRLAICQRENAPHFYEALRDANFSIFLLRKISSQASTELVFLNIWLHRVSPANLFGDRVFVDSNQSTKQFETFSRNTGWHATKSELLLIWVIAKVLTSYILSILDKKICFCIFNNYRDNRVSKSRATVRLCFHIETPWDPTGGHRWSRALPSMDHRWTTGDHRWKWKSQKRPSCLKKSMYFGI